MASPSPEAFWALLGESKLVDPARLDSLRRQFEGIPIPPKADAKTITDLLVGWLEKQQVVTRWQAEQVLLGKKGPFFLGDYRLLERLPTGRGGMIFRARHEPAEGPARLVSLAVLDAKLCQQPAVGADLKQRIKLTREANDNTLIGSLETKKVAGTMCIIAEDVPVVSLEEELTRRGPVPPTRPPACFCHWRRRWPICTGWGWCMGRSRSTRCAASRRQPGSRIIPGGCG